MRVLLVDHDSVVRRDVVDHLEQQDFSVTTAPTVAAAREQLSLATFDIAILNVEPRDGSGLEILRMIREVSTPLHVIVLSGQAHERNRLDALELGADDYIVRPFFVRELTARLVAVRRHETRAGDRLLVYGAIAIDLSSRTATFNNAALSLTPMEFGLLAFLAARPGHAFSRDELLRSVWKSSADWQRESTVTEHVRTLRAKIETDPNQPRLLQTVRGIGYRFDPPSEGETDASTVSAEEPQPLVGMFIAVDGRIVSADDAAAKLLGVTTKADLLGRDALEFVAAQSLDAARARGPAHAAGLSPESQIVALRTPDGPDVYVELSSSTTEWNHRPAIANTMRFRADRGAALRHIITGVVSEVSDAVIVTDDNFQIRSWNGAAERLYGWLEHEVLDRRIEDVLRFVGSDSALIAAKQTLDEKGRWFGRLSLVARDGSPVEVWSSSATIRDDLGRPVLVAGVHRPVIAAPALEATTIATDEAAIRDGLGRGEFVAHYEPVVALEGRKVVAVEGSARWDHPELGLVTPTDLIDPAEHMDAIVEVERVTFDHACRQTTAWRQTGLDLALAVHLSNAQLADTGLFEDIAAMLATSGLDPHVLWLEVTETALVEDIELAADLLHRFAALGVRIAVDNFGIGWASLTYLKQLPVHALKIDKHFVAGIADDPQDAAITRSILSLGKELGLGVVAVGVETEAQDAALRALGCTFGQGPLYGSPAWALAVS